MKRKNNRMPESEWIRRPLKHGRARPVFFGIALLLLAGLAVRRAQAAPSHERSVDGRIIEGDGTPVNGAIVYLNDLRTKGVSTYITQADGAYSFQQLSPDDDYTLWAQLGNRKTHVRTISSFDDRPQFHFIMKLPAAKSAQ
jgi:hypothetical protein